MVVLLADIVKNREMNFIDMFLLPTWIGIIMDSQPVVIQPHLPRYNTFVSIISVLVILIGGAVLTGYYFNIVFLKSITPFWLAMRANTAICFILSGISLWLLRKENGSNVSYIIAKILAMIIVIFSMLTFFQYIFNYNLGIDQFFFRDEEKIEDILFPGRLVVQIHHSNYVRIRMCFPFLPPAKQDSAGGHWS